MIGRGAIVREASAGTSHLVNKEPDAEPDQEEGDDPVNGKVMEEASIADQKDAAKADEPEGARGKTVTGYGQIWINRVGGAVP